MAASAPQSQSQSQSQSQPLSAEEEALKSNTDCVYFLASPLTCKKGSDCEYRHSDIARLNPRDCWYWLNSNCLNPKCAYRHPPLDGLLGAQIPTSTGSSAPVATHVSNASTKQGVPCVYFQNGCCLKGDWCPFLHAPNSSSTKALAMPGATFSVESTTIKKPLAALEKSVQQQKVVSINAAKSFKDSSGAKLPVQLESAPPRNEFIMKRRAPQQSGVTEFSGQRSAPQQSGITEFLGHRSAPQVSNGNPVSWSNRAQQPQPLEDPESLASKDAEEVSREPSPGFDVLVDDDARDSDFYAGEDRYGMSREHDTEYDIDHPNDDYNVITGVDDEGYHDRFGFDSLEHRKGQYGWEQHRASSGGSYRERRPYGKLDNLGQVDESDLRHRLAKHKKPNGLRSVISREYARDNMQGDRNYQGLRWDGQHNSSRENYVSSRLRGRIQLPRRSLSPNNRDMVRGTDRGDRARTNIPLRIHDRIQGRVEEAYNNGGKNYRSQQSRREYESDNITDFAAPKSLSELKKRKNAEPSAQHVTDQQSLGKRKHLILDGQHQQGGNDVSFEGPKPLEEILKRKRRETVGTNSSNNDILVEKNQEGSTNNETSTHVGNNEAHENSTSIKDTDTDKRKLKDGELIEDGVDQEFQPSEQRDGEFDYDQMGGEDYELYDGENGDAEGEYLEEEEEEDNDDDLAKKMGVMYS